MFYSKCEEASKFSLGHYFLSTVMIIYGKIHKAQKIHMKKKVPPEIHRRMSSTIHSNRVICFYQWELGFELLTFYLKLISNNFFFQFIWYSWYFLVYYASKSFTFGTVKWTFFFFFSKEKQQKDTKRSENFKWEELRAKKRDLHMHLVLGSLATLSPKTMSQLTWIHYLHP